MKSRCSPVSERHNLRVTEILWELLGLAVDISPHDLVIVGSNPARGSQPKICGKMGAMAPAMDRYRVVRYGKRNVAKIIMYPPYYVRSMKMLKTQ